jgi:transcriptional regulator with XRE-family HTH domain
MNGETPGETIRRARQESRLTQAQLASQLGIHKNTVADWEKNKYFPERHYAALNKILRISLRPPGAPEPEPEPLIPAAVMRVIRDADRDEEWKLEAIEALEAIELERRSGERGDQGGRPHDGRQSLAG